MDDQSAEEALKKFILSRVEDVYLEALHQPRIRYKGKTLRQFMDVLIIDFQATPEERAEVRKLISTAWDPNQHIITLFAKSHNIGRNEKCHPISSTRLHQSGVYGSKRNKAVHKGM